MAVRVWMPTRVVTCPRCEGSGWRVDKFSVRADPLSVRMPGDRPVRSDGFLFDTERPCDLCAGGGHLTVNEWATDE